MFPRDSEAPLTNMGMDYFNGIGWTLKTVMQLDNMYYYVSSMVWRSTKTFRDMFLFILAYWRQN